MTLLRTKRRCAIPGGFGPQARAAVTLLLFVPLLARSACLGQTAPGSADTEFRPAYGERADVPSAEAAAQDVTAAERAPVGPRSVEGLVGPAVAGEPATPPAVAGGYERRAAAPPGVGSGDVVGLSAAPALTGNSVRIGILDVVGKLAIVAALVYVSIFGLRTAWQRRLGGAGPPGRELRVRERAPLGGNRCLYLVEAGVKLMLIGADGNHISLLADLDPDGNGAQEGEIQWPDDRQDGRSASANGGTRADAEQFARSSVARARKRDLLLEALRGQRA